MVFFPGFPSGLVLYHIVSNPSPSSVRSSLPYRGSARKQKWGQPREEKKSRFGVGRIRRIRHPA
ncbi:hypothetical protein KCP75_20430 [Salmonella enterica subsp. enterica]|nr:hypothetical protein KCP75_20430 [Salmonella enterica subsp. enterica]